MGRAAVNVGAGAGSYESATLEVTAVGPSASMRAQRPAHLSAAVDAVDAVAEKLPSGDDAFDAAMTAFGVHQWRDLTTGLREVRRVARGPLVVLTCDPALVRDLWLYEYAPEVLDTEARRYPAIADLTEALGGPASVPGCRYPSTAPTAATRRPTRAPRCCSTPVLDRRARRGASSTSSRANGSPRICGPTWTAEQGTPGSALGGNNPSTKARWS
ncbi:methyltransferase domain-containing protein [Kitasatospora sp. NPDC001603]|uniref:class I SAM-dependent methyltransferase n=1 Tax=Kitasatospora sp. NPDC001603 TaxID=3154388 RepID=UPI003325CB06